MNKILPIIKSFDKKDKTVIINIIISFSVRFVALILALVKMPLYINFFNNDEILGIWFTILSMLTWILNFDLGIGNGLRNNLVKAIETNDEENIKKYISSSYLSIFIVIIIIGIIGFIIIPNVNWNNFFNTSDNLINNMIFVKTMYIILIGLLIQFFLKLINSILYALQKSFYPGLFTLISEILLLIVVLILDKNMVISNKLIIMAISYGICVSLPLLIANATVFLTKLKKYKPSLNFFSFKTAKSILLIGGMFFWIQIMYMIIVNTNDYLITWFVGPKYVVEYQIYNKIFSLVGTLFTLLLTPIWSMVTKALVNRDFDWIEKLYKKLKIITVLAVACELAIIPFLQLAINIWLKSEAINVNYFYALLFAISGSLLIWNGVISTLANGMSKLRVQFYTLTIGVFLNIPLAYLFCRLFEGWIGVVLANVISFIPYCVIQPIFIKKYLKEFKTHNVLNNKKRRNK